MEQTALRAYRLARVREQLVRSDYAAVVLWDPVNIRYATDASNMQVWTLHTPVRYAFIPAQGPVVMFEPRTSRHLAEGIDIIDEVRPSVAFLYSLTGPRTLEMARQWAREIADLVRVHGAGSQRLALDRCGLAGAHELSRLGVSLHDGEEVMQHARSVKSNDEIEALKSAIAACEAAVRAMREALEPGLTERELWAILHRENIARGGEWIETRLLSSGPRTNPWFQETSDRVMEAGDLVCFDTDLIGRYGYFADFSRAWLVGDGKPSDEQRRLYAVAYEQLHHNLSLLEPGLSLREFATKAYRLADEFVPNRYADIAHGAGMGVEHPFVPPPEDFAESGYDASIEENMVLSVESYAGAVGGREGVKLEQEVLVTATGTVALSTYPFEDSFLPA